MQAGRVEGGLAFAFEIGRDDHVHQLGSEAFARGRVNGGAAGFDPVQREVVTLDRPGQIDCAIGNRQRTVFRRIGRQFVQRQRQPHGLLAAQPQRRAVQPDAVAAVQMRTQGPRHHVGDEGAVAQTGEQPLRTRQRHDARTDGIARLLDRVRVAQAGRYHRRGDRQDVLDPVQQFLLHDLLVAPRLHDLGHVHGDVDQTGDAAVVVEQRAVAEGPEGLLVEPVAGHDEAHFLVVGALAGQGLVDQRLNVVPDIRPDAPEGLTQGTAFPLAQGGRIGIIVEHRQFRPPEHACGMLLPQQQPHSRQKRG